VFKEKYNACIDERPYNYNPALTPYLKSKCATSDEGEYFHIRNAGKKELTVKLF
jgi:hypothetical protein